MMPYRFRSGSWQPARFRWADHAVVSVLLIVVAYLRGLDYLIGDDVWSAKDFMLATAPEWVWGGVGFVLGATILTWGMATARHMIVYVGHGWLGTAYAVNSLALILAVAPSWGVAVVLAGVFFIAGVAVGCHWLMARRKGWLAAVIVFAVVAVFAVLMSLSSNYDGVRGGGATGIISCIHFLHMVRTGGRPLRVERSHITEVSVEGGSGE